MTGPGGQRRWPASPARADRLAVLVFLVVPLLAFGIPAVVGHLSLVGDNMSQNFPLRVLVGRQLRGGTLPVYNPYIWGGAPLLGGWNAGALYPLTLLFAVLPATAAWAVNLMAVYWVGAVGLYALLRVLGLGPLPSFLGGATFAFSGVLEVHVVHIGLVAGLSWLPVVLVALVRLARVETPGARARWIGVLGAAGGLCILAGEPRAIDTVAIVAVAFALWTARRPGFPRLPYATSAAAGALVAALLGAVQWLPGADAVASSQRAGGGYALYSAGSLPPRWLPLIVDPHLLGGSGSFGTAPWIADYNLPEVMSYAGLVPLVAAVVLAVSLVTRHRGDRWPEWLLWEGLALLGVLLAFGAFTPLGHLLALVPVFGGQRLQSRNIAITDLALAVLLAYWVDGLLGRRPAGGVPTAARVAGSLPLLVAGALAVSALVSPLVVAEWAGARASQAVNAAPQRPLSLVPLALIAACAVILVAADRLARAQLAWLVGTAVVVDLAVFGLTTVWTVDLTPAPSLSAVGTTVNPTGTTPGAPVPPASFGRAGRYAIYDPTNTDAQQLAAVSSPDLNILDRRYSVVGYGSIVDGTYAQVLGAHAANGNGTDALSLAAIGDGTLDQLSTTTLLTQPESLTVPTPTVVSRAGVPSPAPSPTGTRVVSAGRPGRWSFGRALDVASITLPIVDPGPQRDGAGRVRVAFEERGDAVTDPSATLGRTRRALTLRLGRPRAATGLVIALSAGVRTFGPPTIRTAAGTRYVAAGVLQDALTTSGWTYESGDGTLAYYRNRHPVPPLSARPPSARPPSARPPSAAPGAPVRVRAVGGTSVVPTAARVTSPDGAEVVRSVAMIKGWTAEWRPAGGGAVRPLAVRADGLVQSVRVPAGSGTVTWRYRAPGLQAGIVGTLVGLVATAALLLAEPVRRARVRRGSAGTHR